MLFKEIIAVHTESHMKPINAVWERSRVTKCVAGCTLGFKGLILLGTTKLFLKRILFLGDETRLM
jgi:hypothetical protein